MDFVYSMTPSSKRRAHKLSQYPELQTYPDHVLRDIARNDAANYDFRMQAVELLVVRKSVFANHEDLLPLVEELRAEFDGVIFEYPPSEDKTTPPVLSASVTTKTMSVESEVGKPPSPRKPRKTRTTDASIPS
jgi:hypothetical protein